MIHFYPWSKGKHILEEEKRKREEQHYAHVKNDISSKQKMHIGQRTAERPARIFREVKHASVILQTHLWDDATIQHLVHPVLKDKERRGYH